MDKESFLDVIKCAPYIVILYLGFHVLLFFCKLIHLFVLPKVGFACNLRKYGEWAVITGATDGIGKEFAFQLAEKGFSIVLISRSEEKLSKVANEIISKHKVMTKTIAYDFSKTDGYDMIQERLKGLDIGILINNVGAGTKGVVGYPDCDMDNVFQVLNINISSAVGMTHVITQMMTQQKRGLILHISSIASKIDVPVMSIYGSTKSFLNKFSRCSSYDHDKVIHHQVLAPGYVVTNLSKVEESITAPTAKAYVRSALGTAGRVSFTHGFWAHELICWFISWMPHSIVVGMSMRARNKMRKEE